MINSSTDTGTTFGCFFDDLRAGNYSYLAIARDKAGNSKILYDDCFFFEVFEVSEEPKDDSEDFIAFIFFICLIGALAGISSFAGFKLYKKRNEKERAWKLPAIRIRDKEWRDKTRLQNKLVRGLNNLNRGKELKKYSKKKDCFI